MYYFFTRIGSGFLLIILLFFFLFIYFLNKSTKNEFVSLTINQVKQIHTVTQQLIIPSFLIDNTTDFDALIKRISLNMNFRLSLIDTNGSVLGDSEMNPKLITNQLSKKEVLEAVKHSIGTNFEEYHNLENDLLYVCIPIQMFNKNIAFLRYGIELKELSATINEQNKIIFFISIALAIISLIATYIISKIISKPIIQISNAAERVGKGDFNTKILLNQKYKMKEISSIFNNMIFKVKSLFEEISIQKEELAGIIKSIREGLLVIDMEGKILLSNDGFKQIVKKDDILGNYYWEIISNNKFADFIKKTQKKRKSYFDEITLDGKYYLCSYNFLDAKKETVIIISDITQLKILENIKKDLVVNVSHELRTPLTAIKGFIETLEDEIGEEHKNYIGIIHRHTNRLINIVEDLMTLSKLEDSSSKLEKSIVNIKDILDNVYKIFVQRLNEKNLHFELKIEENLPKISVDIYRIEQLFINLIDNAIKYTDCGTIFVDISATDDMMQIIIQDTGIGIPKDKLERIFERFFTVDKSRSRKVGGTGLGLSIVKHIVLQHSGEIKLESELGSGTKFIVLLPLKANE